MKEKPHLSWQEQRRERQRRKRAAWLQEPPIDIVAFYKEVLGVENEETAELFARTTRYVFRDKGEVYQHPGEPVTVIRFLLSGISRGYVIDENGQDHNIRFDYEYGNLLFGASSLSEPANLFMEAITDMEMLELPITVALDGLRSNFDIMMAFEAALSRDHRKQVEVQIALSTMIGEERYRWFCKNYGALVDEIPQNYIASFLGVQPQSLSRIKRTIKEKSAS